MGELLEKIEAYAEDRLDTNQRIAFEKELEENPELQTQWATYQEAQEVLNQAASLIIKKQLQEWSPQRREKKASLKLQKQAKPNIRMGNSWLVAASIAACLMLALWWWNGANQQIYPDQFVPYPLTQLRGNPANGDDWKMAYQMEDYAKAYGILKAIEMDGIEADHLFFQANAALAIGQPAEAIPPLQQLIATENIRYTQAAEWYLYLGLHGQQPS